MVYFTVVSINTINKHKTYQYDNKCRDKLLLTPPPNSYNISNLDLFLNVLL